MSATAFYVTAELAVSDPACVDEVRQALQQLCWHTQQEPGCLRFELQQDVAQPTRFVLWECFVDEAAFWRHFELPHTRAYLALGLTVVVQHLQTRAIAPAPPAAAVEAAEVTRYQRGWDKLKQVDGEAGERVIAALQDIAPALAHYTIAFPFGEVYQDPVLTLKEREIATVAALAALGNATPQLKVHLHGALNVGCSRAEIIALLTQMAVYAGFPAAINGVLAAKEVFAERDAA